MALPTIINSEKDFSEGRVCFEHVGDLCPMNKMYISRFKKVLSPRYRACRDAIGWTAKNSMGSKDPWKGDIGVKIYFWGRCDIDALNKVILDAMQGIVYENDRQVVEMSVWKFKGKGILKVTVKKLP